MEIKVIRKIIYIFLLANIYSSFLLDSNILKSSKNTDPKNQKSEDISSEKFIDKFEINNESAQLYNKEKIYHQASNIKGNLTSNLLKESESKSEEICVNKTNEVLKYLFNPSESNLDFNLFQSFILYSGGSINDLGDYSNCINDKNSNYVLARVNVSNAFLNLGMCYFKECEAAYLNSAKDDFVIFINQKFKMNLTHNQIIFSNPRENLKKLRNNKVTGLILFLVIMALFASLSIFAIIFKKKISADPSPRKVLNLYKNYEKFIDSNKDLKNDSSYFYENPNSDYTVQELAKVVKNGERKPKNFLKHKVARFLNLFNMIENKNCILNVHNGNITYEFLRILDGVRVLSTCWVLWGHVFVIPLNIGLRNVYEILNLSEKFHYCLLTSAILSVDVFFFLSGFLVFFHITNHYNENTYKVYFFSLSLLQRYLRLLPFYFIGIFGIYYLLPFVINGPRNEDVGMFLSSCEKFWWHNLLYIQNFFSKTYKENGNLVSCMPHSWYLADDMVYFVFSSILILIFYNKRLIRNIIFVITFLFSCIWQVIKCLEHGFSTSYKELTNINGDFFNDFYIQPINRVTPYILGILYCELFLATDVYKQGKINDEDNLKNNDNGSEVYYVDEEKNIFRKINLYIQARDKLCIIIFITSLLQINFAIFINWVPQNYHLVIGWHAFLITFNKVFFVSGLANIFHLIFLGKFSIIKNFLSWPIFSILSRLTYGVYVLHIYIIVIFFYNSNTSYRMDFVEFSFISIGILFITLAISFMCVLLYESPIINLLKNFKKNTSKIYVK